MVCFGGLEFIAAGYLLAEHSKKKKKEEQQRIEEEEAALRAQSSHQSSHHHRRRRRHSDGERDEKRRERAWAEPLPKKGHKDDGYRPHKEKRRDESPRRREKRRDDSRDHRPSSPAPRHASPLPSKSHMNRMYDGNYAMSATQLGRPYSPRQPSQALATHLTPQQPHYPRTGSAPPPSRLSPSDHHPAPAYQQRPMAPASHHNQIIPAHEQIHNSIFPPVPPSLYRSSPLSQAATSVPLSQAIAPQTSRPNRGTNYPTYRPPTPPSPPPPASAFSSRPQYTTPPSQSQALALPPPPEGVWELSAGDMDHHPNPAHRRTSSTTSRPHVHFADGLDVHKNISDPPPPYQAY